MNRLEKFRTKSKDLKIEGHDVTLKIEGLAFPELAEFGQLVDEKKTVKALDYMLYVTLRKAVPTKEEDSKEGMDDESIRDEIKKMDGKVALQLIDCIKEVSNLPTEDDNQKKE